MDLHQPALNAIGRRRDSRLRLAIPARLETIHGNYRAALLDLSQSGAQIRVEEPQTGGGDALLTWLHYEAFGRIVWSTAAHAGLEFDDMLAPATLITTRDLAERSTSQQNSRAAFEEARAWYQGARI